MGTPYAPEIVKARKLMAYAEVGLLRGDTAAKVAKVMPNGGTMHLFDYADVLQRVTNRLSTVNPKVNYVPHANSRKKRDSYCWTLLRMLRRKSPVRFDYIYLDGAHTFDVDGLAFFLLDKFLTIGGFIEFDDYTWTHQASCDNHVRAMLSRGAVDAAHNLKTKVEEQFTEEQRKTPHIREVVDLLVKPMLNYTEIHPNRVYRKVDVLVPRKQTV